MEQKNMTSWIDKINSLILEMNRGGERFAQEMVDQGIRRGSIEWMARNIKFQRGWSDIYQKETGRRLGRDYREVVNPKFWIAWIVSKLL